MLIYADTEDDTPELFKRGISGFNKSVLQIAAIDHDGHKTIFENKESDLKKRKLRAAKITKDFLTWISSRSLEGEETICHFFNLQYDLGNLFGDELDALDLQMVGGRLIYARWRNVTFRDVFNIWPMSVKVLGKAVGLEKLDFDTGGTDYVFRDVEIIRKAMLIAYELADEMGIDKFPSTLGGLCVKFWHAMGGANWQCAWTLAREALFGGRVELFSHGGRGNIFYTDINSLYPDMMRLPYPDDYYPLDTFAKGWGIAKVKIVIPKCKIGPLPVRMEDGSVYYPYGTIDSKIEEKAGRSNAVWTFHEIRNAVEHGASVKKVYEAFGSLTADYPYRAFVDKFYALRKEEKDDGKRLFYKLLMNNLYGQLGCSGKVTRSLELQKCMARDDEKKEWIQTVEGVPYGTKLLADIQMPLPDHANYLHAAYVTSYARLQLQKFLRIIPIEDLIYCDTDSLFFFSKDDAPPFAIGKEIGEMKLEAQLTACAAYAPKMYKTTEKGGKKTFKAKGVPNRFSDPDNAKIDKRIRKGESRDDCARRLKLRKLPQQYIEDKEATYAMPFKMRESIAFFDELKKTAVPHEKTRKLSVWRAVTKVNQTNYARKDFDGEYFFPKKHCQPEEK